MRLLMRVYYILLTNRVYFGIIIVYTIFYGGDFPLNGMKNNNKGESRLLPGKLQLGLAAVMCAALTVGSAVCFTKQELLVSAVGFIAAAAILSFFLIFVRHAAAMLVPAASAVISILVTTEVSASIAVSAAVTVVAVTYTVCHMKLLDSFKQFLVTAIVYSAAGGGLFLLIIRYVYGAVPEGILAFGDRIASMAPTLAELAAQSGTVEYGTALSMFSVLLTDVSIYIPAVIFTLGIMSAWLMRGFFSMFTAISGIPSLFGGRQSSAPKPMAVIFLVLSFFGLVLGFLPKSAFYAVSNIRSIISVIFMGEGVRLFFSSFGTGARKRKSPVFVPAFLVFALFFPVMIPMILPYYGAFGILLAPGRRTENRPQ